MRLQVQMDELQPQFSIGIGECGPYRSRMYRTPFQAQVEGDAGQRQYARLGSHNQLIEHYADDKKQGIEQLYRRIQLHSFLQVETGLECGKQMRRFTAC